MCPYYDVNKSPTEEARKRRASGRAASMRVGIRGDYV
eukprot:SAG31_NODE_21985_length_536_cov_1.064073_1_plen_36_part_10